MAITLNCISSLFSYWNFRSTYRLQVHDSRHLQSCVQKDAGCVRAGKATNTAHICNDFLQCNTNYVGQSNCVFAGINTRKNTSYCMHRSYIKRRRPTAQNWLPFSISSCQPVTISPTFSDFFTAFFIFCSSSSKSVLLLCPDLYISSAVLYNIPVI